MIVSDSVGLLLKLWFKFVLSTTDVETGQDFVGSAAIKSFEPTVQLVADSLLGLVVVWASYRIMWGHGVRSQYTARVLLPRLFLAGVLINFSQPMFQAAVTASNTLCSGDHQLSDHPRLAVVVAHVQGQPARQRLRGHHDRDAGARV